MNTPSVNSATAQDRERVISAIVLGFVNDPITRWSWPDSYDYLTYFPAFTNAFGGKAFDHGTAHTVADFWVARFGCPPAFSPMKRRWPA